MAYRLFEGRDHASAYKKYRFTPPVELKDMVIHYLDKKRVPPHELAVDVGCGTGQNTRFLAPHFKKVVGIDVSESQVEEAKAVPGFPNVTYRTAKAEELPFPDESVDLLTAATAAHWFDPPKFVAEADRVLKPAGCVALLGFSDNTSKFNYKDCGDKLMSIYLEAKEAVKPYTTKPVSQAESKLEELYQTIHFPDKERVHYQVKSTISVENIVGFISTWSMFQAFKAAEPTAAVKLLTNTKERFLQEMGVTSPEVEVEREWDYYCVLASKPLTLL